MPYITAKIDRDRRKIPAVSRRLASGAFVSAIKYAPKTTNSTAIGKLIKNSQCQDPVQSSRKLPIFGPSTAAIPFIAPSGQGPSPVFLWESRENVRAADDENPAASKRLNQPRYQKEREALAQSNKQRTKSEQANLNEKEFFLP